MGLRLKGRERGSKTGRLRSWIGVWDSIMDL